LRVYTKPLFQWRKALSTSTDGATLYDFASRGLRNLESLHRSLRRREFIFRPAVALHYNFNGKHRTLYIAPWEERIVDLLLYRVLNQRLHDWFSPGAYAYRDHGYGLDPCQARIAALLRASSSPLYLVKRDIADYFASVNHEILLAQLRTLVDPADYLFRLLEERIRFLYEEEGEPMRAAVGIPFGTAAACLFANIYLSGLDREMESLPRLHWFRYADDLLAVSASRETAVQAARKLESVLATLQLRLKPSHSADLMVTSAAHVVDIRTGLAEPPPAGTSADVPNAAEPEAAAAPAADAAADTAFAPARGFRHLGLQFSAGGGVALSRDKLRKVRNLFRFAFRRARRRWKKLPDARAQARALVAIVTETIERGVRNVAVLDYYLKHVDDEQQLAQLDRWLAEEILSSVFGGHRKGHFRRIGFQELRAMGLPSLLHRRRLLRRGEIQSAFFIWQREKATRAFRGTVARPTRPQGDAVFSSFPEAAANQGP